MIVYEEITSSAAFMIEAGGLFTNKKRVVILNPTFCIES